MKSTLEDIYSRQNSQTSSITDKLQEVKQAIQDKQITVDMGGVESRLDTANTRLNDIKNKIPSLGTEDLPEGNTTQIEDQSLISDAENQNRLNTAKTYLSGVLSNFVSNNPLLSVIQGTSINASGSSSVNFNWGSYGSSTADAGQWGGVLDVLGVVMVALSTISGIIVVMRD